MQRRGQELGREPSMTPAGKYVLASTRSISIPALAVPHLGAPSACDEDDSRATYLPAYLHCPLFRHIEAVTRMHGPESMPVR